MPIRQPQGIALLVGLVLLIATPCGAVDYIGHQELDAESHSAPNMVCNSQVHGLQPFDPAGVYSAVALFDSITLNSDHTFVWAGGLSRKWHLSGEYIVHDNLLSLKTIAEEFHFTIVPWSGRVYLIETSKLIDFCNAVNAGYEPALFGGDFPMRYAVKHKRVTGVPQVPADWKGYLLKKPLTGQVVSIAPTDKQQLYTDGSGGTPTFSINVRMNQTQGLKPGMMLLIPTTPDYQDALGPYYKVTVREVQAEQVIAEFPWYGNTMPIQVGAQVSTHLDKATAESYQDPFKGWKFRNGADGPTLYPPTKK